MYGDIENVKTLTGITPDDLGLADETALDTKLNTWMEQIASEINSRLAQGEVYSDQPSYAAIEGIAERKCAEIVSMARQKRQDDVIEIDEFEAMYVDTGKVFEGLSEELRPHQKRRVNVFLGGEL